MINTFKINLSTLIILTLVVLLILQRQCGQKEDIGEVTVKTEVKWNTVTIDSPVYIPKWKTKIVFQTDTLPVDTAAILKDYFTSYVYEDTVRLDSFGYLTIHDTISKNKIASRKVKTAVKIPTTIITNTLTVNKTRFYTGISLSGNTQTINQINGELLLKTKSGNVYGLGIGVNSLWQPIISASMYWELKMKKINLKSKLL